MSKSILQGMHFREKLNLLIICQRRDRAKLCEEFSKQKSSVSQLATPQLSRIIDLMIKDITAILIWSEDYRALADWYKEKLDLKVLEELNHPEDTGVLFVVGHMRLW